MSKVYIFSGAGISASAGVPTFRDANGLWAGFDPKVVCDYRTWTENYDLVHEFYNERRKALENVKPTAMHHKIAEWQAHYGADNIINITTNVDDLFTRAGVKDVLYLHGYITEIVHCSEKRIEDIGYAAVDYKKYRELDNMIKPNVVFFGEHAPNYNALYGLSAGMQPDDLVIFIGMSYNVVPVDMCLPMWRVTPQTVNVNPDELTNYDFPFSVNINSQSDHAIPRLDAMIQKIFDYKRVEDEKPIVQNGEVLGRAVQGSGQIPE